MIRNISTTPYFGIRLTSELERGFEKTKEKIEDFYGENSDEYTEFYTDLKTVKEKSSDYVVGIGCRKAACKPYYFTMFNKKDKKKYFVSGITSFNKEGLYTPESLKSLAITAKVTEWEDNKAMKFQRKR